jgi:hypothetical protein
MSRGDNGLDRYSGRAGSPGTICGLCLPKAICSLTFFLAVMGSGGLEGGCMICCRASSGSPARLLWPLFLGGSSTAIWLVDVFMGKKLKYWHVMVDQDRTLFRFLVLLGQD